MLSDKKSIAFAKWKHFVVVLQSNYIYQVYMQTIPWF